MAKRKIAPGDRVVTVRLPAEQIEGLHALFLRDGITQSESIRRGVQMFLDAKGIAPRKRGK